MDPVVDAIKNTPKRYNLKHIRLVVTTGLLTIMLPAGSATAQNDPADVVSNAIDDVVAQAAEIGSLLLFAYGFYQLVNAGMSDQKSEPLKKVVVSWGLGIVVRSWDAFQSFITSNNVDSATIKGVTETTATIDITSHTTLVIDIVHTLI